MHRKKNISLIDAQKEKHFINWCTERKTLCTERKTFHFINLCTERKTCAIYERKTFH